MRKPTRNGTGMRLLWGVLAAICMSCATSARAAQYWKGAGATSSMSDDGNWDKPGTWSGTTYTTGDNKYFRDSAMARPCNFPRLATITNDINVIGHIMIQTGPKSNPFVFDNTAGKTLTCGGGGLTFDNNCAAILLGGKYSLSAITVPRTEDMTRASYLTLDGADVTSTGDMYVRLGGLYSTNSNLNASGKTLYCSYHSGAAQDPQSEVDKVGGTWAFKYLRIGCTSNTVARFYHRSGTLTTESYICVGGYKTSVPNIDSLLDITGGTVKNAAADLCIGDYGLEGSIARVRVANDAQYFSQNYIYVGNRSAACLTIEDSALVTANGRVVICRYSGDDESTGGWTNGETCDIELNGGTLSTEFVVYGDGSAPATIAFNGGTLQARRDDDANMPFIATNEHLSITVGANGGTIDTNGKSVTIGPRIMDAAGENGSMRFVGGGTAILEGSVGWTGGTTVDVDTTLSIPEAISGEGLSFVIPAGLADGVYTVVKVASGTFGDNVLSSAQLPSDEKATFCLSASKTEIICSYGLSATATPVARWDFNNYNPANPGSLSVLDATIGSNAKPCTNEVNAAATVMSNLGGMYVMNDGLEEGNYAIAIPKFTSVGLPIPDSVKNHNWTMKIRFRYPNDGNTYRSFFDRNPGSGSDNSDLFLKSGAPGGGQFGSAVGSYETLLAPDVWHTLTIKADATRFRLAIFLDDNPRAAIYKADRMNSSPWGTNYFNDGSETADCITKFDGVGHLLLCADNNGEDNLMFIDYVELYDDTAADNLRTDEKIWTGAAGDGLMSTPGNWLDNAAPEAGDLLDFTMIQNPVEVTADIVDGQGNPVEFYTLAAGSELVTLNGSLALRSLLNAHNLAVAQNASLAISGSLISYASKNTKPLLYSNEGSVTVGGTVNFRSNGSASGESVVVQYAVTSDNTQPIVASGLAYDADGWSDYLVASLGSQSNGKGLWVIGKDGMKFPNSRDIGHSGFHFRGSSEITLNSSANWTVAESYRHHGNDFIVENSSHVTVDTTDYFDGTTPRTVTFEGHINMNSSHATPLTFTGNGNVVINTYMTPRDGVTHTNTVKNTLAVTDSVTFQINANKPFIGTGTMSFASGTTLLVPAGSAYVACGLSMSAGSTISLGQAVDKDNAPLTVGSIEIPDGDGLVNIVVNGVEGQQLEEGSYKLVKCLSDLNSATAGRFTTDSFTLPSGSFGKFSVVDNTLVYTVAQAPVASVGDVMYPSVQAAVCACTSTAAERVKLLRSSDELVKVSEGSTVYFDENENTFTGFFEGAGVVNMAAQPTKGAALCTVDWTGTFQVAWNPGNVRFVFSDFGNTNSFVELMVPFSAFPCSAWTNGSCPTETLPNLILSADWTVNDGYGENTTKFASLSGTGSLTVQGTGSGVTPITYEFASIDADKFSGTLGGGIRTRGTFKFGDIKALLAGPGALLVKFDANAQFAGIASTTVNGKEADLAVKTIDGQRGVYVSVGGDVCEVNGVGYQTIAEALADCSAAHPVKLLMDVDETVELDEGDELYLDEDEFMFCGKFAGSGMVSMDKAPKKYSYTGAANGAVLFDDDWSGTFCVAWDVNGGRFVFDDFGTDSSIVKLAADGGFTGVPSGAWASGAVGDGAPIVETEILLDSDWTIAGLDDFEGSTTTITTLSGWATLEVTAEYACTYEIETVVGYDMNFSSETATIKICDFSDESGIDPEEGDHLAMYDDPFVYDLAGLTVNGKKCLYSVEDGAITFLGFAADDSFYDDDGMGGQFEVQASTIAKLPAGVTDPTSKPDGSSLSYAQLDALGLLNGDGTFDSLAIVSIVLNEDGYPVVTANVAENDDYDVTCFLMAKDELDDGWPEDLDDAVAEGAPGEGLVDETGSDAGFYKVVVQIGNK